MPPVASRRSIFVSASRRAGGDQLRLWRGLPQMQAQQRRDMSALRCGGRSPWPFASFASPSRRGEPLGRPFQRKLGKKGRPRKTYSGGGFTNPIDSEIGIGYSNAGKEGLPASIRQAYAPLLGVSVRCVSVKRAGV